MRSRTVLPLYSASQDYLVISSAPTNAYKGLKLIEAGALTAVGDYECEIATDGCNVIEVELMCSAVTGTVSVALRAMRFHSPGTDGAAGSYRAADEDTGTLVAGTPEVFTLTDLRGKKICKMVISIGAGESATFAPGTSSSSPAAIAEFNVL